ncbi:MAG: flagellar type III secretion system pore protein FliP [Thermoguttaceae bacterium]|nr:flagellar type III secretion system pore protein FliP [Thermoguttaceae bacterium]
MNKARNWEGERSRTAAFFRFVAAFATVVSFAAFGESATAQAGGAIPAAVETERSGKATLGVDTSDLDFYNDSNGAISGEVGAVARPAGIGEVDETAQAAGIGSVGQKTRTAKVGEVAQTATNAEEWRKEIEFDGGAENANFWTRGPSGWFGPESVSTSLKTLLTFSILAVAPAILLATTSFVRISVVLSLLRQGIGAGQVPSNQTIAALAVFLSLLIMTPVWSEVYEAAVVPYSEGQMSSAEAFQRGQAPIRTFLWRQIEKTGNVETIGVFTQFIPGKENPEFYEDVPWRALAPAFLLSELKTAFLIGFQILIPFLIIDVVVSSVLVSTGMMMLPPTVVSLPFKLALFVLSDGWTLVAKSLLASFAWSGAA